MRHHRQSQRWVCALHYGHDYHVRASCHVQLPSLPAAKRVSNLQGADDEDDQDEEDEEADDGEQADGDDDDEEEEEEDDEEEEAETHADNGKKGGSSSEVKEPPKKKHKVRYRCMQSCGSCLLKRLHIEFPFLPA